MKKEYNWCDGLDDERFIIEIQKRKLTVGDILSAMKGFPVGRTFLFLDYFADFCRPTPHQLHSFCRLIAFEKIDQNYRERLFNLIGLVVDEPSFLLLMARDLNIIAYPEVFPLFQPLNPSPMDYCWLFNEFPSFRKPQYLKDFVSLQPDKIYLNYLTGVLNIDKKWISHGVKKTPHRTKRTKTKTLNS